MRFQVRRATADDAPGAARVMQASGLDHTPDLARIARVIPEHSTLVAVENDEIVGFIDAFMTCAANGVVRWEIDLVGVHPDWQGQGIARQLVAESVAEGRRQGAARTRALIRSDNSPSRRTFAWCGFKPDRVLFNLYIGSPQGGYMVNIPPDSFLIAVNTLTYAGIWTEGEWSLAALRYARAVIQRYGWSAAGALIPVDELDTMRLAERAGYSLVGEFDWWWLD